MLSAVTIGAAASKKLRFPLHNAAIFSLSASEASGPAAIMTGVSGISVISLRTTSISGSLSILSVTRAENLSLSTASAPPAGTAVFFAHSMQSEPISSISALRSPAAQPSLVALKELEHTSSASPVLLWAGENFSGFISYSVTPMPLFASCHAASTPAKPPPTTVMSVIFFCLFFSHNRSLR